MKKIWVAIVAIIIILLGAFFLYKNKTNNAESEYQTVKIERNNLIASVGATGAVRSNQSALLNWQTSGTVGNLNVSVGDRVAEGVMLASLEKKSLSQNVILAEAELVEAEKTLDDLLQSAGTATAQARIDLRETEERLASAQAYRDYLDSPHEYNEIVQKRTAHGTEYEVFTVEVHVDVTDEETIAEADQNLALAQAEYDDALREWERVADGVNEADLNAAQVKIDAAQATLNLVHISAPFDGTITQVECMAGDQVSAETFAFRMDDFSKLLVDVELSEIDINSVTEGQVAILSFDAILEKEYKGKVVEVGRIGKDTQGVINFTVTVELTDADTLVRPGMTAEVDILIEEVENALLIPNKAVRLVDGDRVIYLLDENGLPEMVEIRLGASADGMSILLSDNLEEGAEIILNPPSEPAMGDGPPGRMER